ncbi:MULTISPECIES: LytTR family DNA-binding domain-containing protein [unclassified Aureispira]|uniref:LytR/AlgR family response regulator transcription factor n=1 Tax=unclassified Aureispira TaxID=2649989 RepID=UPI0006978760|nr:MULTISPECIES: LytTR family DNA-binding domain-containing protein [unclassified Aureispira]WMX14682.1 LytTR family DNA-binding domain-containing protein [Aureispira sp. CCB-E]
MQKIRAIIIEDEPQAREMLTTLLEDYCQDVHIIGTASNVQDGVAAIKKLVPDLIFLDIEMPNEKGLELFKYFPKVDFDVIFTTAYDQYAINALRLSALDYLLKPIDLKDLRTALNAFREKKHQTYINQALRYQFAAEQQSSQSKRIILPNGEGYIFIDVEDIMYCQAEKSYTSFIMKDGNKHWVSKTIKEYSDLLEGFGFLRVHRSSLINPKFVTKLIKTRPSSVIMKDGESITISKNRRDELLEDLLNI